MKKEPKTLRSDGFHSPGWYIWVIGSPFQSNLSAVRYDQINYKINEKNHFQYP
jgi:hypothetical protein